MTEFDKVLENRLRRIAKRRGFRIEKSRRRDPKAFDYGGYMLIDASAKTVILGNTGFAYSATLDEIQKYLEK